MEQTERVRQVTEGVEKLKAILDGNNKDDREWLVRAATLLGRLEIWAIEGYSEVTCDTRDLTDIIRRWLEKEKQCG